MSERLLKISPGFQFSVNVKFDIRNPQKIGSYIPTEKALLLLEDLVCSLEDKSHDRARLLIGPYGTGKSHLIAVFGAIMEGKLPVSTFTPILEKISASGMTELAQKLENIIGRKRYLTVVINGNGKDLDQSFMYGLYHALTESGLDDILPSTIYSQIKERLDLWNKEFPDTYTKFVSLLKANYSMEIEGYNSLLSDWNNKSITIFKEFYPTLTAGAEFNPFIVADISELYQDIAKKIQDQYTGILVIFDEFNKYLESSVKNKEIFDLKPLQDFAEMCNRSNEEQVHLVLVSHQHISQYASKLSRELVDEWRKVEGRFKSFELTQRSSKTYNLISKVIIKNKEKWPKFIELHNNQFSYLKNKANIFGLFSDLSDSELDDWVVKGCYPLHPTTTFALPKISNKIAQNERTIFTFLATNDFNTLGNFIDNNEEQRFKNLTIDILFDYFEPLMKKQNYQDPIYNIWLNVNRSIQKLKETNKLAERALKGLGMIKSVAEEMNFPPTIEFLKFALNVFQDQEEEFNTIVHILTQEKIIYVRKSDGYIQFFEGSDVDFSAEIEKVRGNYRYQKLFNLSSILNEHFTPYPVIANRYNDKFEMTRFFFPKYYSFNDLKNGIDWDRELENLNYIDGILALVIAETEKESNELETVINNNCHSQILFATSKHFIQLRDEAFNYQALQILRADKTFVEKDPLIIIELEAYLDDYEEQIEESLNRLTEPRTEDVIYYYQRDKIDYISSGAKLSRYVSYICEKVFYNTPRINNELINKNNITATIAGARVKVNTGILAKIIKENLDLKGHGPDVSIFRSMLKRTGVYQETKIGPQFKIPEDKNFAEVIDVIKKWILSSADNSITFNDIFLKLRKPPYGLRLGIIPVILALSLRDYMEYLVIKDNREIEAPLSASLLEQVSKYPEQISIQLEAWDKEKEQYINELSKMFAFYIDNKEDASNKLFPVGTALKRWFISLPKFSRETRKYDGHIDAFRKALKSTSLDSKELLFSRLPFHLNKDKVFCSENFQVYLEKIHKAKKELEGHLQAVNNELNIFLSLQFCQQENSLNCLSEVRTWYEGLAEESKKHLFSAMAGEFMETVSDFKGYDQNKFVETLARNMTGLRLEDWSDELYENFKSTILEAKDSVDKFNKGALTSNGSSNGQLVKIITFNENGPEKERTFEKVEISSLGEILYTSLESNIESFADSISANEKRQILLSLLDKLA